MVKNTMLFESERKESHLLRREEVKALVVTVFQFDVLKSPAVCSGRRLLFAALGDHRPQPVSITFLAPHCTSLSFPERQSLSITAREGLLHGVELSHWVTLRFQLGQQFIESPHSM